ncbi:MAG: hypothetical protein ACLPQS_04470 [Acidimicrobiales bacterium]
MEGDDSGVLARATGLVDPLVEQEDAVRPASRLRWAIPLTVGLVYAAIAVAAYWPTLPLDNSHTQICTCADTSQEVWFLAWVPFALSHGHSLFFSNWILYPSGVNLADNTSMTLLGVIASPITLLLGPVAAYNLVLRAGFVLAGLAMFFTVRRFVAWWPAAFIAGLLYGFSPYMIGQGESHEFLVFTAIPPLVIGIVHDMFVTRRRTTLRNGLYLGLLFAAQYLISSEIFLMMALLTCTGVILSLLYRSSRVRECLVYLGKSAGYAVVACAVVLAYPVWFFLDGTQHVSGPPHPTSNLLAFRGDLVGALVPTPLMQFGTASLFNLGTRLTSGNVLENGLYLGLPLVMLTIGLLIAYRRVPLIAVCGVLAILSYALSLGPRVVVGAKYTSIPGPFAVLAHLPLLQDVETARFSLFTVLFVAVILGIGLDRLLVAGSKAVTTKRVRAVLVASLAVVVLVPLVPRLPYPVGPPAIPPFFTSAAVNQIPAGSVVATYPYPVEKYNEALAWQAVAGMHFRILGGTTFFLPGKDKHSFEDSFPPPALHPSGIEQVFEDALLGPARFHRTVPPSRPIMEQAIQADIAVYKIRTIIIDPSYRNSLWAANYVTAAVGSPPILLRGVLVWFALSPKHFPTILVAPASSP